MIPQINNTIDILWLLIGLIAIVVLIVILVPWGLIFESAIVLLLIYWIAAKFWLRERWIVIKRLFRKKRRWINIDDHDLFI